jgi:hypothetical protein
MPTIESEESSWKLYWLLCRTKLMSAFGTKVPKNDLPDLLEAGCFVDCVIKIECNQQKRQEFMEVRTRSRNAVFACADCILRIQPASRRIRPAVLFEAN